MNGVDEETEQSNEGGTDDFEEINEPQSKRFRADHENSNDFEASDSSPWENPPPNFNSNSNGAQNNNQKGRGGGVGRRQGSRWSNRR